MMVLLDEAVSSREDTVALGVCVGDYIAIDARPVFTEGGFLKSRFIDDKAMVACAFAAIKALKDAGRKPKYDTVFQFTYYEENSGGIPLPEGATELLGLDIGLVSPTNAGTEHTVSICTKDFATVYDYTLTSELVALAERAGCAFVTDVHYRYGSDVGVALRTGVDLRGALIGPGVYGSHSVERTHIDGLAETVKLLLAYLTETR
jgi:putative aminopeptidase FrvX